MNASFEPRRAPVRLERIGKRFDLVIYADGETRRVNVSALELLTLQRDVNDAVAGVVLNILF